MCCVWWDNLLCCQYLHWTKCYLAFKSMMFYHTFSNWITWLDWACLVCSAPHSLLRRQFGRLSSSKVWGRDATEYRSLSRCSVAGTPEQNATVTSGPALEHKTIFLSFKLTRRQQSFPAGPKARKQQIDGHKLGFTCQKYYCASVQSLVGGSHISWVQVCNRFSRYMWAQVNHHFP